MTRRWTVALAIVATFVTSRAHAACDDSFASVAYAPARGEFAMLLFEDRWPANGDLDFNDQAISYNFALAEDARGKTVAVHASFTVLARIASLHNGLHLHLPVPATAVASMVLVNGGQRTPIVPRAGERELVATITEDTALLTDAAVSLLIRFAAPVDLDVGQAPFDLFLARTGEFGHQIHLPAYAGTDGMDRSLFGTADDASWAGWHFVDGQGLPFALHVPQFVPWPQESVALDRVYPDVVAFAASGGAQHADWYLTNVVRALAVEAPVPPTAFQPDFSLLDDGACGCPAGTASCDGACVDLQADALNCGACGYSCVNGRSCIAGRCTPAWQPIATAGGPGPRTVTAAASVGGKVFVMGGVPTCAGSSSTAFSYDPGTDRWVQVASMNRSRAQHSAAASSTNVYVFGGISDCLNGASVGAGLESYDPVANTWTVIDAPGAPTPRYATPLLWTGAELFVCGGGDQSTPWQSTGGRLDPAAGAWSSAGCPLAGCDRSNGTMFAWNGAVYRWGGNGGDAPTGLRYDLGSRDWTRVSLPLNPSGFQVTDQGHYADDGSRVFSLEPAAGGCPATLAVATFDKRTWQWTAPDASPGPGNDLGPWAVIAWTGREVIAWSGPGACGGAATIDAGGRYQPPAP